MIRLGTALKSREYPYHRCLTISDVEHNGGNVVLVRLTTNDGTWPDQDCILSAADWPELDRESTVAYSTCKYGPAVTALGTAIQRGLFQVITPPSADVLRKVIAAGHASAAMPRAAKRLLPGI